MERRREEERKKVPEDGTDEELIVGGRCWASLMFHAILRPRDQAETRREQARSGSRANYRQVFLALRIPAPAAGLLAGGDSHRRSSFYSGIR